MSELDAIRAGDAGPVTVDGLANDLRALGLSEGGVVIVHSSLSSLGWVCGGPQAVIEALFAVLGPAGTLAMPAFSAGDSEPSYWCNPPVPESWWDSIRESMPAFRPDRTPTRALGAVAESFRSWGGARRSDHPQHSFAARGPAAERITANHALDFALGEGSPLARLYELDASVLLLGVDHASNSSLHLAEYRAQWPGRREIEQGAAVLIDGRREWVRYRDLDLDADDDGPQQLGRVARAEAILAPQRALVDFAVEWMTQNR
jgi:aminoglycoside 3-N-acetyltransferase